MREKAFNLNFSEILTKREESPRDTAPLNNIIACIGTPQKQQYRQEHCKTTSANFMGTSFFQVLVAYSGSANISKNGRKISSLNQ